MHWSPRIQSLAHCNSESNKSGPIAVRTCSCPTVLAKPALEPKTGAEIKNS
jgi:hypothetical protein